MRIHAIEIKGHPGFGDLFVDLRDSAGRPERLVVLAGENGCGKTALLESVFASLAPTNLLQQTPRRLPPGRYRIFLEIDDVSRLQNFNGQIAPELHAELANRFPDFKGIVIELDGNSNDRWAFPKYSRADLNLSTVGQFLSDSVIGTNFGCF